MTAQPSPDLPDSLRRQTKPASEDVYQAAAEAYAGIRTDTPYVRSIALGAAFRAAINEAVRLTEQRVRAEMSARIVGLEEHIDSGNRVAHLCGCDNDPIECDHEAARGQAEETIRQLTADLAAMTARAHTAENRTCPHCKHAQDGPASPLRATLPDFRAMVEGSDAGSPENSSGGPA